MTLEIWKSLETKLSVNQFLRHRSHIDYSSVLTPNAIGHPVCYFSYKSLYNIHIYIGTGCMVRESIPGVGEIFRTRPDRPLGLPTLLYNGYRVFPGGKSGRGVALITPPSSAEV